MSNSFVHLELSTDDIAAAKKFYAKVFDWKISASPMPNYLMIDTGSKESGGGITPKMMEGQPTAWLPYVTVDDVKKSVAKAEKNGAKVLVPFQSIGDMGAIGVFMDPTGAAIGVWEKGKAAPAPKKAAKKAGKKDAKKPAKKAATGKK